MKAHRVIATQLHTTKDVSNAAIPKFKGLFQFAQMFYNLSITLYLFILDRDD
jgi:hypothetical protein